MYYEGGGRGGGTGGDLFSLWERVSQLVSSCHRAASLPEFLPGSLTCSSPWRRENAGSRRWGAHRRSAAACVLIPARRNLVRLRSKRQQVPDETALQNLPFYDGSEPTLGVLAVVGRQSCGRHSLGHGLDSSVSKLYSPPQIFFGYFAHSHYRCQMSFSVHVIGWTL